MCRGAEEESAAVEGEAAAPPARGLNSETLRMVQELDISGPTPEPGQPFFLFVFKVLCFELFY